jgi:hypothetical protein
MSPLLHYLLIYDHAEQKLLDALDLGTDAEDAARTYAEYEQSYRDRKGIEIVLVGADSLDTIRQTHAHYFSESAGEPFEKLLAGT